MKGPHAEREEYFRQDFANRARCSERVGEGYLMHTSDCQGCNEYNMLSRRRFLQLSGGTIAAASLPAWLPRIALATDACTDRDTIISIFLRGGADGLTLCVPFGEDAYYAA